MRFLYMIGAVAVFMLCMCDGDQSGIVGSPDHDIRVDQNQSLGVLADGVSELVLKAVVTNTSGLPAAGQQVYFTSTLGEIEKISMTDSRGVAQTRLRSVASEIDLYSSVTATVLDSSSRLYKSTPLFLQLYVDSLAQPVSLKKTQQLTENSATVKVVFRGINIDLVLADSVISADGISSTALDVHVYETTSKQPVQHKIFTANCLKGSVKGSLYTNDQGIANLQVVSATEECVDSVQVVVGSAVIKKQHIRYVTPKLSIAAKETAILADGRSSTTITATLLSNKNTPVSGANIYFATSAGVIDAVAQTNASGKALVTLVADVKPNPAVWITASFSQLTDSTQVAFVTQGEGDLQLLANQERVLRDGVSPVGFQVQLGSGESAAANEKISLFTNVGLLPSSVTTSGNGSANFTFIPDVSTENTTAIIVAQWNDKQTFFNLPLVGLDVSAKVLQDSLPADGTTQTSVRIQLKEAETGIPVVNYPISFGVNNGRISKDAITDDQGVVEQIYTAGDIAGQVEIKMFIGKLQISRPLYLVDIYPSQIKIATETNYIWVRETGEIEQTSITAKIVGISGEPINKPYKVSFQIIQGPGGGETLQAPSGFEAQEIVVSSNQGEAQIKLHAGTKSGAVQVAAELVSMPQIRAQTSQIVIRSGPPYMWISPTDHNNVIQHGTLIVQPGKQNVVFANPVQPISVSAIFTDKYNNPVEQGTAVYFTTTGGLVSSDASTDELGKASAVLQNANPFPMLFTTDAHQLTATNFPDPNGDGSQLLNIIIPDFEYSQISNSLGNMAMNDGVATILAVTNGRDQFNENVKVYVFSNVVYSVGLYRYKAWADKYTLQPGESTTIHIEVFDSNGNPVAAGSTLSVSTDKGKITAKSLMPEVERYGYGSTRFSTSLVNNEEDSETGVETAIVEIELDSPNGDAYTSLTFTLIVPKTEE